MRYTPCMFERCMYFNINALARRLNARWEDSYARFDLTPAHAYLLRLVLSQPGLSQQAIATEMKREKSTITRFLSALEKKGLIERRPVEGNARENAIFGSPAAMAIRDELEATGQQLYEELRDTLGDEAFKRFVGEARAFNAKI